jgi:hypothetical protein
LERIQQKFAALCFKRFFPQVDYSYDLALDQLKLHTLRKRRYHLDDVFLTQVYRGSKFCSSVSETVGLRVPVRYIRDFSMFSVCSSSKNCPARSASAANVVCRDLDIYGTKPLSLKYILYFSTLMFVMLLMSVGTLMYVEQKLSLKYIL